VTVPADPTMLLSVRENHCESGQTHRREACPILRTEIEMFTCFYDSRLLAVVIPLALAVAVAWIAGQGALAVLAEGFGWGIPSPTPPATGVAAEGFGWGAAFPVSSRVWV
jgi:hypothetical protein